MESCHVLVNFSTTASVLAAFIVFIPSVNDLTKKHFHLLSSRVFGLSGSGSYKNSPYFTF